MEVRKLYDEEDGFESALTVRLNQDATGYFICESEEDKNSSSFQQISVFAFVQGNRIHTVFYLRL
jgi:hypothetical protein